MKNTESNESADLDARREACRVFKRDGLIAAFLSAGENLAHHLADDNRVETAWALRGLLAALDGSEADFGARDAGLYRADHARGVRAALASEITLS